jgi:lauroyl/myristoyl acyltransferase
MVGIVPIYELKVYVPNEPVKPRWLFKLMERLRLRFEGIIFDPVAKGETISKAARHLEAGRIVVLLIDIPKKAGSGVLCQIGNGEAWFPVGPVKLALEQGATIFPVFPLWTTDWKLRIVVD